MQKPRIPPHPTTKTRNIVFSSDGVSCAEKDELLKTYPTKDPNVLWLYHWVDEVLL